MTPQALLVVLPHLFASHALTPQALLEKDPRHFVSVGLECARIWKLQVL